MLTWKFYLHLHFQHSICQLVLPSFFKYYPSSWLHIFLVTPTAKFNWQACAQETNFFFNPLLSNVNVWVLKFNTQSSHHANYIVVADVLQWKINFNHWRQYYRWKFWFWAIPAPAQQHHLAGAEVLGAVPTWELLSFPSPIPQCTCS